MNTIYCAWGGVLKLVEACQLFWYPSLYIYNSTIKRTLCYDVVKNWDAINKEKGCGDPRSLKKYDSEVVK